MSFFIDMKGGKRAKFIYDHNVYEQVFGHVYEPSKKWTMFALFACTKNVIFLKAG